jgi:hypothetical protein
MEDFYMLLHGYTIGVAPVKYNTANHRCFNVVAYRGQILFLADNVIVICEFYEFFENYNIYVNNGFIKSYEVE